MVKKWLSERRQRVGLGRSFSEWQDVHSGVPQGSVLGPLLFLVYINDLDCNLSSKVCKFADDTKLGNFVKNHEDYLSVQEDLDKLFVWSEVWQMKFNVEKCAVIHVGHKNNQYKYRLGDTVMESMSGERDLGVYMDQTLKFSQHCSNIASQANSTLGLIKRTITSRNKDVLLKLYKALVRPILDYCAQVYCPCT